MFRQMRRNRQQLSQERCEEILNRATSGVLACAFLFYFIPLKEAEVCCAFCAMFFF